jgi:type I restriction enzyme S subunit
VDRRIRRYIRAKQKLIALLEEQKQAIVHQAVTRGLDPSVRLKPSGVAWLGDVPEHWEVLPLRRRWAVVDCKHLTVPFVDDGVPLASVPEVQSFDIQLSKAKRTTPDWYNVLVAGGRAPRRNDLVYCRNVSVGAAAFVGTDDTFAMGQDVCLIRSTSQNQRYLNYFLHSPAMTRQLMMLLVGSTFKRINVSEIKGLLIVVPPKPEQDAIAEHLDRAFVEIDQPILTIRHQIALLREYRTRLIADVVTGQVDVRAAAAQLPEETEERDALEEVEELAEDEEDEELVEENEEADG